MPIPPYRNPLTCSTLRGFQRCLNHDYIVLKESRQTISHLLLYFYLHSHFCLPSIQFLIFLAFLTIISCEKRLFLLLLEPMKPHILRQTCLAKLPPHRTALRLVVLYLSPPPHSSLLLTSALSALFSASFYPSPQQPPSSYPQYHHPRNRL